MTSARAVTYLDKVMTWSGVPCREVADVCGVSITAVQQWRLGLYMPSVAYARMISAEFKIPLHLLRPDLLDPPPGWQPLPLELATEARRAPKAKLQRKRANGLQTVKPAEQQSAA